MSATPTPRTDAASFNVSWTGDECPDVVWADFAEGLEQELTQLRADVRPLVEAWNGISNDYPTPPALSQAFTAFLAAHPEFKKTEL